MRGKTPEPHPPCLHGDRPYLLGQMKTLLHLFMINIVMSSIEVVNRLKIGSDIKYHEIELKTMWKW